MRMLALWLFAGALAVWGLSVLIGHAPPRIRLILLMPLAFGLAVGWGLGRLADECGVHRSRRAAAVVFVLTCAGLANVAAAAYRETAAAARRLVERKPEQLLALRVLESGAEGDPVLQRRVEEERRRLKPGFRDYLAGRLLSMGRVPGPWPSVVWGAEVLIGAAMAVWIFRRAARPHTPDAGPSDPGLSADATP